VILTSLDDDATELAARAGWAIKPQGACKGELCVPLFGAADVRGVAERLGMAVVHDEQHAVYAVGPETVAGKALTTAEAPDITLPDVNGQNFTLSSLRGQKVLLLAWASW
jgi:hypothetical protein